MAAITTHLLHNLGMITLFPLLQCLVFNEADVPICPVNWMRNVEVDHWR